MKSNIQIRFSADDVKTIDAIENYFIRHECHTKRRYKLDGTLYAMDVWCAYFSKWILLELIEQTENAEFFFGIHSAE